MVLEPELESFSYIRENLSDLFNLEPWVKKSLHFIRAKCWLHHETFSVTGNKAISNKPYKFYTTVSTFGLWSISVGGARLIKTAEAQSESPCWTNMSKWIRFTEARVLHQNPLYDERVLS